MDQHALEEKISDLPLGKIGYFETIGSTNDEAVRWAEAGVPDFSLILADEQTQGRGRAARKWFTYPGTGLAFTLILRPTDGEVQAGANTPRFTGLGALGVSQTLQKKFNLSAQIKWPNDVLVNRQKLCGVLAESHWLGDQLVALILGIGINIAATSIPVAGPRFPATCVETELKREINRLDLLHDILAEIISWRAQLTETIFLQTWEANLAFRDEWVRISTSQHSAGENAPPQIGHILGLESDGSLRFETHAGETVIIRSGEVSSPDGPVRLRPVDSSPN